MASQHPPARNAPVKPRPSLNLRDALAAPLPASPLRQSSPAQSTPSLALCRSSSSLSMRSTGRASPSPSLVRKASFNSLRNATSPLPSPKVASRRSSSNFMALAPAPEEPPELTPAMISNQHFSHELANLATVDQTREDGGGITSGVKHPQTIVLVHDSCYGHRFSRLRTKQADLNNIVERPERMRAGVMGISTAYVRLGDRHSEGNHAPHPRKSPSSLGVPFQIRKTTRMVPLSAAPVVAVHGKALTKEVQTMCETAQSKLATGTSEIKRSDDSKRSFHLGDLYLSNESLDALQGALGGTLDAVDAVFSETEPNSHPSRAFVCIRPPGHHCSSDYPSGFCWLNNVHVGIQHAVQKYGLTHAAIIDFDLHHGDGSQEIAWAHNEHMFYPLKPTPLSKRPFIGYYSLHDINSFPCEGGDREKVQNASLCIDNAHGQSIWNVHLQPWKTEADFWNLYESKYKILLEKARNFLCQQTNERQNLKGNQPSTPKAAIFISAGFDASEHEGDGMQRHKVNVPTEFYARFTRDIVALAQDPATSAAGRVISVLEGGYSNKALMSGILAHISGLCHPGTPTIEDDDTSLISGMASMGLNNLAPPQIPPPIRPFICSPYTTDWWSVPNLDLLEQLLDPQAVAAASAAAKKLRIATYSSPTQASTLRAVDPTKIHLGHRALPGASSRPSSPPPPFIHWSVSASELCNLLIPFNQETRSHVATSLAEPRKREKTISEEPAVLSTTTVPKTSGRLLRGRKLKFSPEAPANTKPVAAVTAQKASIDRRKTIAEALLKPEPLAEAAKEPRRRLSTASTVSTITTTVTPPQATRPRSSKAAVGGTGSLDVKRARNNTPPVSQKLRVHVSAASQAPSAQADPVDIATNGIKRIIIRVPSRDEYTAKSKPVPTTVKPAAPTKLSSTSANGIKKTSASAHSLFPAARQNFSAKRVTAAATSKLPSSSAPAPVANHHPDVVVKNDEKVPAATVQPTIPPPSQQQLPIPSAAANGNHPYYPPAAHAVDPALQRLFPAVTPPAAAVLNTTTLLTNGQQAAAVLPSNWPQQRLLLQQQQAWVQEAPQTALAAAASGMPPQPYSQIQWMMPNSDLPLKPNES